MARTTSSDRVASRRRAVEPTGIAPSALAGILEVELGLQHLDLKKQSEALREANVELERARDHYRDLFDLAPVAYLTLLAPATITNANLAAARLLGVPVAELRDASFTSFLLPGHAKHFELHRHEVSNRGSSQTDLTLVSRDGKRHDVRLESVRNSPTTNDPALSTWRMTIANRTDVTETKGQAAPAVQLAESGEPMSPRLVTIEGEHLPVSAFELQWSRTGWSFTGIVDAVLTGRSIAALEILGLVRPAVVDKIHVHSEKTSVAGRVLKRGPAPK